MYNQTASSHSMYNATNSTNASQVVCVIDNKNQTYTQTYTQPIIPSSYLPEYSMDVSIFSYMYTLFLAFGCYSILNPASARSYALKTIVGLAKYTIIGYGLFKEHVYKPYVKHMHPKLLRLLNIDDGINEIVVIKNGKVIHSFKTMELFVKNNPIPFVKEFSDDDSDGEEEEEEDEEHDHCQESEHACKDNSQSQSQSQSHLDSVLSDKVDYTKKCDQINELINAFNSHSLDETPSNTNASETSESEDTEEKSTNDDIRDDYILDPTAYDFIIRNFYYEDEKTGETHSYVFKYDIFYKSEMIEKYDVNMIKEKYVSTKKFIGISLKTNDEKYSINLTSPNNYYVSDNSIFNYSFLKWYMMKHHNIKLSRDYVISGIDNYVEMYKINPGKKIIVHNNRFELVDDETFVIDDTDANTDTDNHIDNHIDVDSDTESESDDESSSSKTQSESENKNESIKVINMNLEETHEMCDIEILDYD